MFESSIESARRRKLRKLKLALGAGAVVLLGLIGFFISPLPGRIKRAMAGTPVKKAVDPVKAETDDIIRRESERILAKQAEDYEEKISDLKRQLAAASAKAPPHTDSPDQNDTATETYGPESNVRQLRSGIPFKAEIKIDHGTLASKERVTPDSYTANYTLNVRLPAPAKTLNELQASNPKLGKILPGLGEILTKGAEVSKSYYTLYDLKTNRLKEDATALNELLTKHNLFDCETILNLKSAGGRRAMLLQADMDVVSDGSDGDRLATMADNITTSSNYQPSTSYFWNKKTQTPNPLLAGWEKRAAAGEKEIADKTTPDERKKWLRRRVADLKRGIGDMKAHSFLIAEQDPFIVLPGNIAVNRADPFAPGIGDYALVIYGDKILPAIIGDAGPNYKVGEASLRIAKELNTKATPNNRPVSDLKVTYLMFPGTKDADRGPPDYDAWRTKCEALAKEMGGIGEGFQLGTWKNLIPPPPAPTPPPTSTPVPPPGQGIPQLPVTPQPPAPTAPVGPPPKIGPAIPPVNPPAPAPATPPTGH